MKNRKLIICAAVLILLLAGVIAGLCSRGTTIAFYGVDDSTRLALQNYVQDWAKEKNVKLKFSVLDDRKTLKSQALSVNNAALVFTVSGHAVQFAADKSARKSGFSPDLLSAMTSSMKSSAVLNADGSLVKALPVLTDNFEISVNYSAFKNSGLAAITTWNDLEAFFRQQKTKLDAPLNFAGGDSSVLLDLLGALAEAFDGAVEYNRAAEMIKSAAEKKWNHLALAESLCGSYNAPLYSAAKKLSEWYKAGYLNRDCFNYTEKDIKAYMNARLSSTVFMPLNHHRRVDTNTIKFFSTIYLPSANLPGSRAFTAPVVYAVPQKKNSKLALLAQYLTSVEGQEKLSRESGLAPVLSHCRTPDRQADDVRYWVAATNSPLAGLSREADLTKKQKDLLGEELGGIIRQGKF